MSGVTCRFCRFRLSSGRLGGGGGLDCRLLLQLFRYGSIVEKAQEAGIRYFLLAGALAFGTFMKKIRHGVSRGILDRIFASTSRTHDFWEELDFG